MAFAQERGGVEPPKRQDDPAPDHLEREAPASVVAVTNTSPSVPADVPTGGREPGHEIDLVPPECPTGCQPIAITPMTTIKDDTWVFLPKGTGLRGRVLFIPHDGHGGRRLVARTAVHDKLSAEGAFAHPGLVLRLGRDSESRVWVCARQPNTWELIRFQPGLALAVVVAAVNGIAVGLTATGNFFTGLKGDVSLWFVGTVFAASLLQSVSKLYKELSDATAGKAGKSVTIGVVVVALAVVVFISGRSDSPHRGGRPTTTSTRPTVPVSAPPTLPPTTATPVPSNPQP